MAEKAILFDTSHCTGCKACQVACKTWNLLPSPIGTNENKFSGTHQNPPDLNGYTRLIMTFHEEESTVANKRINWAFGRRACQHCTDAPCAKICPAGAITRDEETGFVTADSSKCVGCHYCEMACPFDVPRFDGEKELINKCTGCADRVANGMAPACVTTCQPEALKFGDRDEMIALAHERLDFLKAHGYENACIYGENEMGGLHVIQVLKHGVEAHGQVVDPQEAFVLKFAHIMKPVTGVVCALLPFAFGAMYALASGYSRDKLTYNPETGDTISMITGDVVQTGDPQSPKSVPVHMTENLPDGKIKDAFCSVLKVKGGEEHE